MKKFKVYFVQSPYGEYSSDVTLLAEDVTFNPSMKLLTFTAKNQEIAIFNFDNIAGYALISEPAKEA